MTSASIYHSLECQTYYATANVCTLSDNGNVKHKAVELKRTEVYTFSKTSDLPLKIGELFAQMCVMICSRSSRAVEGKVCSASHRKEFIMRGQGYFATMKIERSKKINITVVRSIASLQSNDYCYYFSKLTI